jgi:hypothetical protein
MKKVNLILKLILFILALVISIRHIYKLSHKLFKNKIRASDKIFMNNAWTAFQYAEFNMFINNDDSKQNTYSTIKRKIKQNIIKWSSNQRWFTIDKISGMMKKSKLSISEYLQRIFLTTPPTIENNIIPYYVVFFEKECKFIVFLSHYHCDGQIFMSFMNHASGNKQCINWKKYKYIPIVSDIYLIKHLTQLYFTVGNYKQKLKLQPDLANICTVNLDITNKKHDRFDVYAIIFHMIFKYVNVNCNKLKVAFTMGINDEPQYHNRIGIVIKTIHKKQTHEEYKKMFSKILSKKVLREGVCSYDLVRNFPTHLMRRGMNSHIDIVLSAFRYNTLSEMCSEPMCEYDLSSFIGLGRTPMYINSITKQNKLTISMKIATDDFYYNDFLKHEGGAKHYYTFKKNSNIYKDKYKQTFRKSLNKTPK